MDFIRDDFAVFASAEKLPRWYRSINEYDRKLGRLLWWQERLWDSFITAFPKYSDLTFPTICDVFQYCYLHNQRLNMSSDSPLQWKITKADEKVCPFPAEVSTSGRSLRPFACKICSAECLHLGSRNQQIAQIFSDSVGIFLSEEARNALSGISERSLCGRLAMILDSKLKDAGITGYYVDLEYNRKQDGQIKTILDGDFKIIPVTCDLIVHTRGEAFLRDNLLAIEMKKSNHAESEKNKDRERLRALTKDSFDDVWSYDGHTHPEHVCGYELGIYMELDLNFREWHFEAYEKGSRQAAWNHKF